MLKPNEIIEIKYIQKYQTKEQLHIRIWFSPFIQWFKFYFLNLTVRSVIFNLDHKIESLHFISKQKQINHIIEDNRITKVILVTNAYNKGKSIL